MFTQRRRTVRAGAKTVQCLRVLAAAVCGAQLLLASPSTPARANDSVAHIATGGLVLSRSDEIEMQSEDLYISMDEIRVHYRFFNRSEQDITTLVAFPLPDLRARTDYDNFVIPYEEEPENFLGFLTEVDGTPVTAKVEQRAFALELDRTQVLRDLGIPLAPHVKETRDILDRLRPGAQQQLRGLGLLAYEEYDIGNGMERHAVPLWTLKTTYYWEQTFPARTTIVVEHRYKPSIGASAGTMIGSDYADDAALADYKRRFCVEDSFIAAVERIRNSEVKAGKAYFTEANLEYVLSTGANWAGPIGQFRLVVDKGKPGNLVTFCGEDVKKISATQFEMRKTDYWPYRELEVLILERHEVE